ncbi:hypothetical protein [Sulfurimonas sp.]
MYKILILLAFVFFANCSNIKITPVICEELASQPGAVIPDECRDYSEEEATKAFNKVVDEKKVSDKDLEFSREK